MKAPATINLNGSKYHRLCPVGELYTNKYGKIEMTSEFVDAGYSNFVSGRFPLKPEIDIDHQGGLSQGIVVDMFRYKDNENDFGLYGKIQWTEEGIKNVSKNLYKYFSPTIRDYSDEETGEKIYPVFEGFSLTNRPVLKKSLGNAIELSENNEKAIYYLSESNGSVVNNNQQIGGNQMGYQEELKLLQAKYGLAENVIQTKQEPVTQQVTLSDVESIVAKSIEKILMQLSEKPKVSEPKAEPVLQTKEDEGEKKVKLSEDEPKVKVKDDEKSSFLLGDILAKEREEKIMYKNTLIERDKREKADKINQMLDMAEGVGKISKAEREKWYTLADKDFDTAKGVIDNLASDPSFIGKNTNFALGDYITLDIEQRGKELGIDPKKIIERRKKYLSNK